MLLRRYIVREVVRLFGAILIGLLVLLVTIQLAAYLDDAVAGKVASPDVLRLVLYKTGARVGEVLPLAFFLAAFTALVRLRRDNELVVMRLAGLKPRTIAIAMLGCAAIVAFSGAGFTLFAQPHFERGFRDVKHESVRRATILGVQAGRFQPMGEAERVIYAERISDDGAAIENAFVQLTVRDGTRVVSARRAQLEAGDRGRYAVLHDGESYQGAPGRRDYVITAFAQYGVLVEEARQDLAWQGTKFMSARQLLASRDHERRAELNARLSLPLATLVLALLAVVLVPFRQQQQIAIPLLTAIAVYFLYTNLLVVANGLMRVGRTPAWLGSWWLHVAVLIVLSTALSLRGLRNLVRRR
ncbi:MAG: LPS export ABC transporter permease LptF [Gammaproteobacteria bacterium]|nr:LPS export ABC transporter permease LptF [Gammaproteobacteria bacterium]